MLGITEKYNQFKESTYFAGGKFVICATCVCLAATFAAGCLGAVIGSPLLTFPLAMLISHPVIWIIMGVVLTTAYKSAKNYINGNGKGASKGEKSEEKDTELQDLQGKTPEKQARPKTPDRDSGIVPDGTESPENRSRRSSSASLDDSGHGSDSESEQTQKTKVKTYNTAGDGNCFFHAVFGDNSSGQYKAEKAQDMRMEWHKFLSQFTSLDDSSMPDLLRRHLETLFNMFLNKPGDLTRRSDEIKKLVEQTNEKTRNAKDKVGELVGRIIRNFNVSHDKAISDLREYAEALDPDNFDEEIYKTKYNSDVITNSFLHNPELYKAYLEAINNPCYYIFIKEIPILASLANIKINVYYKDNNNEKHEEFEPDPQMINDDQLNQVFCHESYKLNDELWGNKKRETIYLKPGHYERAELKEITPSFRTSSVSSLDKSSSFCSIM
ncbi:hypothetical protein [Wolbachia endosymbiont (group A) of Barypeithes pellucidus]|uniref:hypothetical protein n=1 Tax=Wolbachia endosymbiont (group A) of Barypeithes pellucidus TaxID=3139322 RepID=UPI003CCB2186